MSTAKLRSRLESLFADLENEGLTAPEQSSTRARGWTWECDAEGIYTACSAEVGEILGYPAEDFLGKPFVSAHLPPQSSEQLKATIAAGKFPIELTLQYQFQKNDQSGLMMVNLHVFPPADSPGAATLRGFSQVVEGVEEEKETQPQLVSPTRPLSKQVTEKSRLVSSEKAAILSVPVQLEEQAKGLLEIIDDDPNRIWTEDEQRLVEQVADQLSLALENARLFQAERQRASELDRLVELSRLISQNLELEEVYTVAQRIIGQLMPAEAFFINLLDKSSREFISSYGVDRAIRQPVEHFPIDSGFSGEVLKTRRPLFVNDLSAEQAPFARQPAPGSSQWVKSLMAVPLRFSGEIIGTLSTQSYQTHAYKAYDLKLLETFADHIAIAIQNARLFEQTQRSLAETEILYQASAELNAVQNFSEILAILCKSTILGHHSVMHVAISAYSSPWTGEVPPTSFKDVANWTLNSDIHIPATESPNTHWERVSKVLRPDNITTIYKEQDPELLEDAMQVFGLAGIGVKCILLAPLNAGGSWFGFLHAGFSQPLRFSEGDFRRLMALANQSAIAIQNLDLLEETKRRASQLETAAEIARHTSATLALDDLLKRAVTMICDRYGYYHASIFLVDAEGKSATLLASTGEAGEKLLEAKYQLPVGSRSMIGYVTESGEMLVINDVNQDPLHHPNPLLPETRSELGIPLKIGSRVIGALNVQSNMINGFIPEDTPVLQTLADQIAVAVDNARSYEIAQQAVEESRQRVQELSVLFNTSQALASATMELHEIANIVARRFLEVFKLPKCCISLIEPESEELHSILSLVRAQNGAFQENYPPGNAPKTCPLNGYAEVLQVMEKLTPLLVRVNDANIQPATRAYMKEIGASLLVVLPLAVKGQAIGIITLEAWEEGTNFSLTQTTLAVTLANAAAAALENARLYEVQLSTSEKLREVDKLKTQFLANMSHELRTPLNSIIGFSKVILKGIDGPVSELQEQDLNAIYSAGQHLLNLINDILDISKIEAGKMELAFVDDVNLTDLINSVLSTAVGLVKDKPIQLKQIIPPDLPLVRADPTRLRQVILNLLSNAAKFTEGGSITIEAGLQTSPDEQREVIIQVTDTGIGISPEHQKNLFQPFTQVDGSATRKTGGSGLGLSISRLLVEIHGGRIGVDSTEGKGSCFYFTLPLEPRSAAPQLESGSRVVLVVEGDWEVTYLYDLYLSESNYNIISVSVAAEAVQRAREVQPQAILLDVYLPGGGGWKALEDLKKDPTTRHIPVIVCSLLDERERAFGLGANDYLLKPILKGDLINSMERLERVPDRQS
jgi:signal transduction histidine kinase/putative methionine-R-sulfoxide reductase with GAF domain/ActR/RegA family two-component response regulator